MIQLTALRRALFSLLTCLPVLTVTAAPVAVDDVYTTQEDVPFSPTGPLLVNSNFDSGADSWTYQDDTFGTNAPNNATGSVNTTRGTGGTGCLLVDIGRRPPQPRSSSGAFTRTINLAAATTVEVAMSFRLRVINPSYTGFLQRNAEAVFTVNGTRYGNSGGTSLLRLTVPSNEANQDSDWQTASFNIPLAAGNHTLMLGAYSNSTGDSQHYIEALYDNVTVRIPGNGTVLANDTGGTGTVTATRLTNPANGALTFGSNGNFTYTPNADYFGSDSFTYRASDSTGNSNTATVTINVTAVNDAPLGVTDTHTTVEDTPLTVNAPGVLANDTDVDSTTLTAVSVTQPANGTVTLNANGSFTYTPALNFNGTDSFTYRVSDGALESSPVSVNLTVTAVPDAPQPVADTYYTPSGSALIVNQATQPAGANVTFVIAAPDTPSGGTAQPGDEWRYLDNGTDQGAAWRGLEFDDSTWKTGRGEFGYGDAQDGRPEYTLIEDNPTPGYSSNASDRYITTYFRKIFEVEDFRRISGLTMSLLRDDGAVVWLNGNRIYFENGLGNANYLTTTNGSISNETTHDTIPLPEALPFLRDGDNILAVEVHQQSVSSSDLSFDLGLTALDRPYGGVLANDVEPEGEPMTATVTQQPGNGTLNFNANGTFTYNANTGFQGTDTFTYTASDGTLTSPPVTVTITVGPPFNQPPVAAPNTYNSTEDTVLNVSAIIGVLANDADPESQPLTAVLVSQSANGTVVLAPDGSFTFTPTLNWNGTTTFTYRASDGVKLSPITTVTLNLSAVPDVPTAVADTYRTSVGTPLVVNTASPGSTSPVTLIIAAPETTGGVAQPGDIWRYLDNGTNQGTAWQAVDFDDSAWKEGAGELGYGDSSDNRPEITVVEDDAVPGYSSSSNRYITTYFRKSFTIPDRQRLANLSISLLRDDGAVVYLNGNRVHADGALATANPLTYLTPADNQNNESTHENISLPNAAQHLVDGVNVLAVEVHQNNSTSSDMSFDLGLTADQAGYAGVLYNDSDPEGSPFTASLVTGPANGTLTLNPNGTFTYTPNAGYRGTDTFTYRATDGTGPSTPATVSIIVSTGVNQKPLAGADTYTAVEDVTFTRTAAQGVLANDSDPDGDDITAVLVTGVSSGSLTLNPDGSFTYLGAPNYNGPDSFTYRARDSGNLYSSPVTVNLTVSPANDPPAAAPDSYGTDPGQTLTVPLAQGVLMNDADPDGDNLTAQLVTPPASGTLNLSGNGAFTYTPADPGTFTFTYAAFDGTVQSPPATVTLIVNGRPTAAADSFTTDEDTPLARNAPGVLANDTDPENSPLTATVITQPVQGTLDFTPAGSFTYTPNANYFGTDSFTYTVTDGSRTSLPGTVSITVNAVNDAPAATADTYGVLKDIPLNMPAASGVLSNDTDVDNPALTATLVQTTANGTLTLNSDGSFTYTPQAGFTGPDIFIYRAGDGSLFSTDTTVTLNVAVLVDTVVISEIMFNPTNGIAAQEYIELHNYGALAVDLGGWKFDAGVNYTFPVPSLVPAGGRIVVPADTAAFDARWPGVTNRTSTGWAASGSGLSNSGENIRLERPDFTRPGEFIEVDEVEYSDEGDWAVRQVETVGNNTGWRWNSGADGGGQSLQLRSPQISNDYGQNWTSAAPTPGTANTAAAVTNLAPVILEVQHAPAVPGPAQQVYITCELVDENTSGLSATAHWRLAVNSPGAFTQVPMQDNGQFSDGAAGDGKFGAAIPAQADGSIVEFYVTATDGTLTRSWPATGLSAGGNPLSQAASPNCFYQVDTAAWTGHQPIYRLIMSQPEGEAFVSTDYDKGEGSDTDKNVTVIFGQGADTDIRYQAGMRYRGAGSRGSYRPHNWKLNLPHDQPWQDWTNFNLNSLSAHVLVLGSRLMQGAGLATELGTAAAVRFNGQNRMVTGNPSSVAVYGMYSHQTPMGNEWADIAFPADPGGNIYKKGRGGSAGWRLRESAPGVPNIQGYQNDAWFKETNVTENDWTDLNDLIRTVRQATDVSVTPPAFDFNLAATVADLEQWARWWAFCVIINHRETNLSNGVDDDYSIYIRKADRKAMLLAHDFDTTFSAGDTSTSPTATIWQAYDPSFVGEKSFASAGLDIPRALFHNNRFVRRFKWHLRDLLNTVFTQQNFDAVVESALGASTGTAAWVPQSERDRIRNFMNARRTYIQGLLPAAFTAVSSLPVSNGYFTTTGANDTGLSGTLDGATTDRVLINGVPAVVNNRDNTWTAAGVAAGLLPGLNIVHVQAMSETGAVLASQSFTMHYDDSSTAEKSGALAADEIWTAAGGPYLVSASVTVPAEVTLTIQPGTSLYFAAGAGLNVSNGGRLVAEGTPERPIRFTRQPGSAGVWGGLAVTGSPEVRLSHAIIEFNSLTAITLSAGTVAALDRITFVNNTRAALQLDGSSWTVSNCSFPAMAAGSAYTAVSGNGLAAGGQGVIRDCTFGASSGASDVIRFSNCHRPGPILRVLNNTFAGSGDDIIELLSADAWIEGNVFAHVHKAGTDSAAAVATADTGSGKSEVTLLRNFIYDCDNAVTVKQGCSAALLYNTIARITKTGGTETQSGVVNLADTFDGSQTGAGAVLTGNIITGVESLTRQYLSVLSSVTFSNNILPVAWNGPGTGNVVMADPLLNLALITSPPNAPPSQIRAALAPQSCSPAVGAGIGGLDLGASLPPGIAAGGLPPLVTALNSATILPGPGGTFAAPAWSFGCTHYRWSADGSTWSNDIPVATPLALTGLVSGVQTLHLLGRDDSGVWQTTPTVVTWNVNTALPTVVLSEILADNSLAYPLGTTRPDVVELHNYGPAAVNLAGFGLTDESGVPFKFSFPPGSSIPAGGYLLIMADSLPSWNGELHTGFGLAAGGETVSLFTPSGALADRVTFGPQITDRSVARTGARLGWTLANFTPGAANSAFCDFGPPSALRLNEWLAANDIAVEDDFIEIYNLSPKPVNLSGVMITDNFINLAALRALGDDSVHVVAPLSFIAGNGYVDFIADGNVDRGADHLSFRLAQFHETLGLADAAGTPLDYAVVSVAREDISEGRLTDGGVATGFFTIPTPGFSNNTDLTSEVPLRDALRITEIMYNPSSGSQPEFIELRNTGTEPLDLTGVTFTSGITFTFPAMTLAPGAYTVITDHAARFAAAYPGVTPAGVYTGRLDNAGERLRLEIAGFPIGILDFDFSDAWYPLTDGQGASLQIVNDGRAPSTWGDIESWQAGAPSPGTATSFGVLAGPDRRAAFPAAAVLDGTLFTGSFTAGQITLAWSKVSGPGTVNFTAPASPDTNVTFSAPGIYVLRLTAAAPGPLTSVDNVTVISEESYEDWALRLLPGPIPLDRIKTADPDRDGLSNYIEYALGTHPGASDAGSAWTPGTADGFLTLDYRRNPTALSSIQFIPQISDSLTAWDENPASTAHEQLESDPGVELWRIRDAQPIIPGLHRYLRLKLIVP